MINDVIEEACQIMSQPHDYMAGLFVERDSAERTLKKWLQKEKDRPLMNLGRLIQHIEKRLDEIEYEIKELMK